MSAGLPSEQRYQAMRRVTLVGAVTNLTLATAQIIGGWISHSQALIADGVHTLSDLASDFVVLFAARKANEAADANHPYGHGRIETLATVVVGLVLAGVAVGIMTDAARRLLNPEELLSPTPLALILAAVAIISKETLYHYTMRVAKRVRSRMLEANAWHHRSDVVSSVVVLAGVGATLAGLPFMDAVAAILVALLIGHMGVKLIWNSARELIDTGVETQEQERMLEAVRRLDGIQGVHDLRTRRMAGTLLADVHVQVAPRISVSEGHHIADAVCVAMHGVQDELGDILVHIDPEDDQQGAPSSHLPNRTEMLERLRAQWHDVPASRHVDPVVIHYLQGQVHLELQLPLRAFDSLAEAEAAARQLVASSLRAEDVSQVQVLFRY